MKVSIVTPSYNSSRYIRETILSVVSQAGSFFIEYIIVDNCSTDGTKEIVEEYRRLIESGNYPLACSGVNIKFISEKDSGMYDAINTGFYNATGDIYAWLNADDIYLPGAIATITKVFEKYNDIHWLKGITSYTTHESEIWKAGKCLIYNKNWIASGVYGRELYFIQQDSVFWRSWLWKKSGGIDEAYKRAGDYNLWIKFAKFVPLISICAWVSCFRTVKGQISEDYDAYMREVILQSPGNNLLASKMRIYFRLESRLPRIIRPFIFRNLFGRLSYEIIQVDEDGGLNRLSGEYYKIKNAL